LCLSGWMVAKNAKIWIKLVCVQNLDGVRTCTYVKRIHLDDHGFCAHLDDDHGSCSSGWMVAKNAKIWIKLVCIQNLDGVRTCTYVKAHHLDGHGLCSSG